MQEYIEWLKVYFSTKAVLPHNFEEINYFEAGLIDSLGVIELVEEIETNFNVRFNEMLFQERRFSTVKGLAEIIQKLIQEKKA